MDLWPERGYQTGGTPVPLQSVRTLYKEGPTRPRGNETRGAEHRQASESPYPTTDNTALMNVLALYFCGHASTNDPG